MENYDCNFIRTFFLISARFIPLVTEIKCIFLLLFDKNQLHEIQWNINRKILQETDKNFQEESN